MAQEEGMVEAGAESQAAAYVRPTTRLLMQKVADEMVLLDLDGGLYYGLDPVATRMFELACELPDAAGIVSRLAKEYDAPPSVLRDDLEALLEEMAAAGLVERRGAGGSAGQ